jgi:hypothetical protein
VGDRVNFNFFFQYSLLGVKLHQYNKKRSDSNQDTGNSGSVNVRESSCGKCGIVFQNEVGKSVQFFLLSRF